jgi:hypothetical protein
MCFDNSRPLDPLESNHTPSRDRFSIPAGDQLGGDGQIQDRPPPTGIQPVPRKALHGIPGVAKFTVALEITNRTSHDRPTLA